MKVLVIAPHMDDEVLGCGGTIMRHVGVGDDVAVCIVANRAYNHIYDKTLIDREKKACSEAKELLGYRSLSFFDLKDERLDKCQIDIIVPLEHLVKEIKPDLVYLPHCGDMNQDHRAVFDAVRVACRPNAVHRVKILRSYEVPSSTDQAPILDECPFSPNYYVDIGTFLEKKNLAMACYETESRLYPHPRSSEGLRVYAKKRGMEIGMNAAEAFVVLRDGWWLP